MRWYQPCSQPCPCFVQVKEYRLHTILKAKTISKPSSCFRPHASVQSKHAVYSDSSHLDIQVPKHLNLCIKMWLKSSVLITTTEKDHRHWVWIELNDKDRTILTWNKVALNVNIETTKKTLLWQINTVTV